MHSHLDSSVREMLIAEKGDWLEISKESGVSHSWLSKFVNGHIPKPGYVALRSLHIVLERRATARASRVSGFGELQA